MMAVAQIHSWRGGWTEAFIAGTSMTIQISIASYCIGIALGMLGLRSKTSEVVALRIAGDLYTTVFRSLPELLLIILLFYTGSSLITNTVRDLGISDNFELSGFAAAVIALGCVQGAYATEILRSAHSTVPKGLLEAASALGLSKRQTRGLIIAPIVFKRCLAGMGNLWQGILKDSALVSLVGMRELITVGKLAAVSTKFYLSYFAVTAAIFFILGLASIGAFNTLERRLSRRWA